MVAPRPADYYATWHERPAMGSRKASKSLWIFESTTRRKRYSVTTSAGIKIQPYFDVPAPDDEYLYRFRVQSEPVGADGVVLWVTTATASELAKHAGATDRQAVSDAILRVHGSPQDNLVIGDERAERPAVVPVEVSREAFECLGNRWSGVNDDHSVDYSSSRWVEQRASRL